MPLKLAGEDNAAVQGMDGQGWLREIAANDSLPALKVNQAGAGRLLDVQDGGASVLHGLDGGRIVAADSVEAGTNPAAAGAFRGPNTGQLNFRNAANTSDIGCIGVDSSNRVRLSLSGTDTYTEGELDVQKGIKNTGANHGGEVAVLENLRVKGNVNVRDAADSLNVAALSQSQVALYLQQRSTHIADASVDEGFGWLYVYVSGVTRQLVAKVKQSGVVYTGTVSLA